VKPLRRKGESHLHITDRGGVTKKFGFVGTHVKKEGMEKETLIKGAKGKMWLKIKKALGTRKG